MPWLIIFHMTLRSITITKVTDIYTNGNKTLFLHDRPWISPWIKSISNELDIAIHVIASQLSGQCDVIGNRLWRHQLNENWVSETRKRCVKIVVLSSFMDSFCCVRNKIMYVLLWRTVCALTRVLFWCLFPELLRNSGNKHQNNPLVSAETVRHSSTYVILYVNHVLSSINHVLLCQKWYSKTGVKWIPLLTSLLQSFINN